MEVILMLGIFWTAYGIAGLAGFQHIAQKYQGYSWTRKFKQSCGISWLLLGIPWIVMYVVSLNREPSPLTISVTVVLLGIPSAVYSFRMERKYKAKLSSEQQEKRD